MKNKVMVLGTEYTIETRNWDDDRKLHNAYGYIEQYTKKIILREVESDCLTVENPEELRREIARHELVHAFFVESGIDDWFSDEKLVDWIAIMLPKMVHAMHEAGVMPDAHS